MRRASDIARENPFLEFRLDYLPKPAEGISKIRQFLYELGEVTAIATCRRVTTGGKFKGSMHAEIEILEKAIAAGCDLIDIEIETVERLRPAELERIRARGAALIISYHDFKGTGDLDKVFERIERFHPDYMKVVSTATCLADNLKMMHFLERTSDRANMIGICMGEQGLISRVLGVRAGSVFTFASANPGEETGPGQLAARALHEIYRIDEISPATRVYGVVGDPVAHSLSPLIQNLAFRRETVNAVFLALQTSDMRDLMRLVEDVPLHGLAVTMPFKGEILKQLANTDDLSEKIGACNTVVRALDGKLYGFNTDVAAIVRPLERRLPLQGARILVIGAGGAARAAVFGLKDKGAEVTIVNRTPEAAQKLARQARAKSMKYEQLAKARFDAIVNATPIGMRGHKQQSWLKPEQLNARVVFEMVYNPMETPLMRMAREKGMTVISGVEMFVQQGARQFEIWTGKPAPEDEMLRAVVHALEQRDEAELGHAERAEAAAALSGRKAARKAAPAPKTAAGKGAAAVKTSAKVSAASRNGGGGRDGAKAGAKRKAAKASHAASKPRKQSKPVKAARPGKAAAKPTKPVARKTGATAKPSARAAKPAKGVGAGVATAKKKAGSAAKSSTTGARGTKRGSAAAAGGRRATRKAGKQR